MPILECLFWEFDLVRELGKVLHKEVIFKLRSKGCVGMNKLKRGWSKQEQRPWGRGPRNTYKKTKAGHCGWREVM